VVKRIAQSTRRVPSAILSSNAGQLIYIKIRLIAEQYISTELLVN